MGMITLEEERKKIQELISQGMIKMYNLGYRTGLTEALGIAQSKKPVDFRPTSPDGGDTNAKEQA